MKRVWMAFACTAYVVSARVEKCGDIENRLVKMDFAKGVELKATAGSTFTQLHDESARNDNERHLLCAVPHLPCRT